jgi:two-component system NarL family sensor kinase
MTAERVLSRYGALAALLVIAICDAVGLYWPIQVETPTVLEVTFVLSTTLVPPAVGALIVRRHPRHAVGWLLVLHGLINVTILANDGWADLYARTDRHLWAAAVEQQISQALWPTLYVCIMLVAYVFPTGHVLSNRWRRWVYACLAGYAVFAVAAVFDLDHFDAPLRGVTPPLGHGPHAVLQPIGLVGLVMIMASLVGSVVSARARLKRATGDERRQMLWFTWAALSIPAGLAMCWLDYFVSGGDSVLTLLGVTMVSSIMPLGIGVAILRSRLFDIEVVLSRTLTYGALTALVVGVYAAVLFGVGAALDNRSVAGFIAVVVVAVAIQPVHARLRRRVDRWVYGDRSDPYAALRRLSDRLEATADPAQALRIVTTSVAEALRVDDVRVALDGDTTPSVAGEVRVPLVHQQSRLGDLVVAVPRGRQLTPADRQLLDDLARHAAVVVNAIHLTLDLQASRARLITAREEERRRLRRDLHDGVGPSLAAMVLKLNVLGATVDDPSSTELLGEVRAETKAAIGEIRRLVDDLRPPALDEVGLVGALRQKAESLSAHGGDNPLVVEVTGPDSLPPLPAAVEVAAYRIAMEAVTNVVRHAQATRCVVDIRVDGSLELTVTDNGVGPARSTTPGVGLASMRERAEELGGTFSVGGRTDGGTVVRARLPLPAAPRSQPVDLTDAVTT